MAYNNKKLGAFIVPTGIGASIGGYAGDASTYARKFANNNINLIVNPNVVNAGCFSGITQNMLYTEGYTLDSFFKGEINLIPSNNNKIGIIYDKAIPQDVLNVHINTQNAVKTVYGVDIHAYTITKEPVGVEFYMTDDGISVGDVKNISTLGNLAKNYSQKAVTLLQLFAYLKIRRETMKITQTVRAQTRLEELKQYYRITFQNITKYHVHTLRLLLTIQFIRTL